MKPLRILLFAAVAVLASPLPARAVTACVCIDYSADRGLVTCQTGVSDSECRGGNDALGTCKICEVATADCRPSATLFTAPRSLIDCGQAVQVAPVLTPGRPFTPVPPTLSIPIPGLPFPALSKIELKGGEADRYLLIPWLGQYLAAIYNYLIALAALVATVMIVVGGMQWLLAAGATDKISEAKKRITNAVIGLILALGTYILLYTLNPDLVSFKALKVSSVATEKLEAPEEEDETVAISGGGANCPNPADVVDIPRAPGLNGGGNKVHRDIIAPLTRAAAAAFARGCTLQINSGWRSLATQTQLWNGSLEKTKDDARRHNRIISEDEAVRLTRQATAFPDPQCASPHMTARAVDVAMNCGGEPYLPVLGCAGQNNAPVARRADLQELMHAQGFVRYCAESWHFELGTDRWANANAAGASCGGNWVCRGTEHTPHY